MRANESFGLTTLRDRHVTIEGASVEFTFTGKTSKKQVVRLRDRRWRAWSSAARRFRDTSYSSTWTTTASASVDSGDVNDYLREITGENFTRRTFAPGRDGARGARPAGAWPGGRRETGAA